MVVLTKKRKFIIGFVLSVLFLGAAFVAGALVYARITGQTAPEITSDELMGEVRAISELATVEYRYTNVGKYENSLEFYGWTVPLTAKSFIITYDGAMRLGIDCGEISLEVVGQEIRVWLPEARVLSHEIFEDTLEVLDETHNIFNQLEIGDYRGFATDRKAEMERKARESGMFGDAAANAEQQIGALLRALPGVDGQYSVTFIK